MPKHWTNFRPKNAEEDMLKFRNVHTKRNTEAQRLLIKAYENVHRQYPIVRFYNYKQTSKNYYLKRFGKYEYLECYERPKFLPDGYYFGTDGKFIDLFIIEIENTNRLTNKKIFDISDWWVQFDDQIETKLHILEFNRFGNPQRIVPHTYLGYKYIAECFYNGGEYENGFELLKAYQKETL